MGNKEKDKSLQNSQIRLIKEGICRNRKIKEGICRNRKIKERIEGKENKGGED